MTEPGEEGVRVLLAESVQKVERPVSCELLPLPIPFPEKRGKWKASGYVGSVGVACQEARGLARLGERFGKTATSEAGGRPSAMHLSSLSRICDAHRGISATDCTSIAEAFKAHCCSVPGYTGNGVKQATFKEELVSCPTEARRWQMALLS